ncbi:MAG: WxL protein peptidoglycan domain-containing protein [Candidatus Saccharimonadales bacterium]
MKRKLFNKIALVVSSSLILLLPVTASAATAKSDAVGGNGLKVSPIRTSLTINPGSSKTVTVYVTNVTDTPARLQVIINDFKANSDETGKPDIILNSNQYASSHSLKQFVVPPPDFNLAPHQQKAENVTISVPKGTAGGGYYGAIRFIAAGAPGGNQQVNVAASVGSLVLLKVPGNINEDLRLISLGVSKNGSSGSFFTSGSNLSAVARFENFGNLQEVPFGKFILKKDGKQVASYDVNGGSAPGNVLPDSIRRFSQPLKNLGWGKYTLEGNFGYGDKGTLLSGQKTFYIIPLWLIIAVIVIIILIILAIILGRKELKRHDRKLLANYRRANRRSGRR